MIWCLLRAHTNVCFFLGRMSTSLPKKGTQEYAEAVADEPSDFIDDEHEESKTATVNAADTKVAKKAKDAKEENFQTTLTEKVVVETAQKEIDDFVAKMKPDQQTRMIVVMGVVDVSSTVTSPLSRTNYDHETKQKNLVKNTVPVRVHMGKLKDDYESVVYMGAFCDYWKTLMPLDRSQTNEHVAFMKYFKKERHLYGLPVPASSGSKNVSRGVTPLGDLSINEDEGVGAD
jgi:hypothetical protein